MHPDLAPRPDAATPDDTLDDDTRLPCPHALIAGTLALMTTWADPAPGSALDVASLRSLLARKTACNLMFLAEHPALSPAMRQVMVQARERWQALAVASHAAAAPPPAPMPVPPRATAAAASTSGSECASRAGAVLH